VNHAALAALQAAMALKPLPLDQKPRRAAERSSKLAAAASADMCAAPLRQENDHATQTTTIGMVTLPAAGMAVPGGLLSGAAVR